MSIRRKNSSCCLVFSVCIQQAQIVKVSTPNFAHSGIHAYSYTSASTHISIHTRHKTSHKRVIHHQQHLKKPLNSIHHVLLYFSDISSRQRFLFQQSSPSSPNHPYQRQPRRYQEVHVPSGRLRRRSAELSTASDGPCRKWRIARRGSRRGSVRSCREDGDGLAKWHA